MEGEAGVAGDLLDLSLLLDGEDASATTIVRILDADEARRRVVVVSRVDRCADVLRVEQAFIADEDRMNSGDRGGAA